jgi:ABC-type transporter lipoprotein component MlaA
LDFDQAIKHASFDPYIFQRNAYLQHRNYLIRENNNLITDEDEEDNVDEAE